MDGLKPLLTSAAAAAVALPLLYTYTASALAKRFPTLRNKRICLLIAHPDDEAMFFAPTLLALTRPEAGNHVKILCLSTGKTAIHTILPPPGAPSASQRLADLAGDADGLGETRRKELVKSGMKLGLRDPDDVFVVDNPCVAALPQGGSSPQGPRWHGPLTRRDAARRTDFPDSMTTSWDADKIASLLCGAFAPQLARQRADGSARPTANIDVLVTFDGRGVSSHPNHTSLYHGARAFVAALVRGKAGWASPLDLYTLTTVGVARKYSSFLDVFATLAAWAAAVARLGRDKAHPPALVFMNQLAPGPAGFFAACGAMVRAHQSQMVWFRWLYIAFSRYMVINDLRLDKVRGK